MANAISSLAIHSVGKSGRAVVLPVDGGSKIFKGTLVALLAATAMAVPGSTALSGPAVAVASADADNSSGADGDVRVPLEFDGIWSFDNGTGGDACSEATQFGSIVFMIDDHTIGDNDDGGARQAAGRFAGMNEDGTVRVFVGPINLPLTSTDAALVGIADAGGFTAQTSVEGALQELYQHVESAQAVIPIALGDAVDIATDAALAAFVGGASTTPGTQLTDSKSRTVRWNNDAAPGAFVLNVAKPQDLDDTHDVVVHAMVSKTGATLADATKLTIGAFEHVVGALHDADADMGGDSTAVVGDAVAKTLSEITLTLAAANIHAAPGGIALTVKPKAGTLGTDDFLLHEMWLEYTRKILTA